MGRYSFDFLRAVKRRKIKEPLRRESQRNDPSTLLLLGRRRGSIDTGVISIFLFRISGRNYGRLRHMPNIIWIVWRWQSLNRSSKRRSQNLCSMAHFPRRVCLPTNPGDQDHAWINKLLCSTYADIRILHFCHKGVR